MKVKLFTLFCIIFQVALIPAYGLNYYWVGGSGNWSDFNTHWATSSGGNTFHAQVPQSVDAVIFDANSFTAANQKVTIDQTVVNCGTMDWTSATNNPILESAFSTNELHIYGSLSLISGMSLTFNGKTYFESTTTGQTITSAGQSFKNHVYFQGLGGGWTFLDDFTVASSSSLFLERGSLNTNGKTVTVAYRFSSANTNARSLSLGASVINVGASATQDNAWIVNHTNLLFNSGTSTINLTGTNNLFSLAGTAPATYYNVNFTHASSIPGYQFANDIAAIFNDVAFTGSGTIRGNNTFNNLTFSPGKTYELQAGRTQTILSNLNAIATCNGIINIRSATLATQASISKASGSIVSNYVSLRDINGTGSATFTANNAVDLGNNSGWTINVATANNLYWVGGTGNWDDQNHWSFTSGGPGGACIPTPRDNVFFDANSGFTPSGRTVTINSAATCDSMDWTGAANTPIFAGTGPNTLSIYGSLKFISGMSLTFNGKTYFESTTTGETIISAGQSFKNHVYFQGLGGGWTFLDDFTVASSSSLYLERGSLNTNSQTVTVAYAFTSTNTNARSLTLGASVINVGASATQDNAWTVNHTNLLFNSGTSTINLTGNNNLFSLAGTAPATYYNVNFTYALSIPGYQFANDIAAIFNDVAFTGNGTIRGNNTFNNLTFSPGKTYELQAGRTQTILSNLNASATCNSIINIRSATLGTRASISKASGSIVTDYVTIRDMNALGAATFTANSAVDLGNNAGWTINVAAGKNLYWVGGTGNWNEQNHWSFTSGGTGGACIPTPRDNVFFDANSGFTPSDRTVTINAAATCDSMDWTGAANTPILAGTGPNTLSIYGSLKFISGMSLAFNGNTYFESTAAGETITSAGQSFKNHVYFQGLGGGWTLLDDFTVAGSASLYLERGSLNTNGQTVTIAHGFNSYNTNARTLTLGASVINTGASATQDNAWLVNHTNLLFNAGTSTINLTGTNNLFSLYGTAPATYYNLNFTYASSIPGYQFANDIAAIFNDVSLLGGGTVRGNNTFNNLTFSPGKTYELQAGRTQTIVNGLHISGTGGFPVRIESSTIGSPATFYKATGVVCVDYIRLSDNTATGGATFNAGANSQDLGGNTGWNFNGGGSGVTPAVSISAAPSGAICASTNVQFTATPTQGGSSPSYHWKLNGVLVQTGSSAQFSIDSLKNNDTVTVEMTSNAPCASPSVVVADYTITVSSGAGTVQALANKNQMCTGDSIEVCAPLGFAAYTWNTGETTACIYARYAGNFYVTATDNNGCTASSNRVGIAVFPTPSVSLTINGDTLTAFNAIAYQWYLNNNPIQGATNNILIAPTSGIYQVEITDTNGCKAKSVGTTISVGINDTWVSDKAVHIYPNPSQSGAWMLELDPALTGSTIEAYDYQGRVVYKAEALSAKFSIEMNVAPGIYLLQLRSKDLLIIKKMLKM